MNGAGHARREDVALDRELGAALRPLAPAGACPEPLTLIALAGEAATRAARSPLQAHLSRCLDCALELEGLQRLSAAAPPPRARRPLPAVSTLLGRLRALVAFEPPSELVLNPRGGRAAPTSAAVRRALNDYRQGRLGRACAALTRARQLGDRSPGLALYLGALLLHLGRPAAALPVLHAAARRRRNAESRWYLAQALLALGRGREALAELAAAVRAGGVYATAARTLARRVKAALAERHGA